MRSASSLRSPAAEPGDPPAIHAVRRAAAGRAVRVDSVADLVGDTPLVRLRRIERDCHGVEVWAKCEFANPAGSVKDRAALRIVREGLRAGHLRPGVRLLDSTSGNTGIAYAMVGAALGVPVTLVMPANVTTPRKQVSRAYGVEVVYSSELEGSDGAIVLAKQMAAERPDLYWYADQYSNPNNPLAHYHTTAPEIWAQTQGRVTHFVTGIGTSGTVIGTSRRLRELGPVRCVGIQPDDALHGLEGMKHLPSSIVPKIYDESALDETIWMPTDEGWDCAERLAHEEGLLVGHSSGGNVAGALRVGKRLAAEGRGGVVVTILCDRGDRYFAPLKWERHYTW
jgi:S-sulfo-L-cysteine synthase (O-acetyl-L-serine-dependent)